MNTVLLKKQMTSFETRFRELMAHIDQLKPMLGDVFQSDMFDNIFGMNELCLRAIAESCGCSYDDLEWFCYENDFGKKGYECKVDDQVYKVCNFDDYLKFLSAAGQLTE